MTRTLRLDVNGMTCAGCVARAEKALLAQPGVIEARANLVDRSAQVTLADDGPRPDTIAEALTRAGYPANAAKGEERDITADETRAARRATLIAFVLTCPVFVSEMGAHVVPAFHHWLMANIGQTTLWSLQFLLTTLVMVWPGNGFYRIGLPALLRGAPEMNSLVALGTLAAWGYSTLVLFAPGLLPADARQVYFEPAAVIVTLILLGRWLEARARGRTEDAIRGLRDLQPRTARVQTASGSEDRPVAQLRTGDIILIRPGEAIAADGEVIEGHSAVNEAMLTGEALPVDKRPGDPVTGGTLNTNGTLTVRVTATGDASALARIIDLVRGAQAGRLPIQALADRVVAVFVPIVIALAALTLATWLVFGPSLTFALVAAVSVLIIACPCAMGLATPTSIMVATGRAAQKGVLFRKGEALQTLSDVSVVAFDKTGTLTRGAPSLAHIWIAPGFDRDTVLATAAAVETHSEHPLAKAITEAAAGLTLPQAEAHDIATGRGLSAMVSGQRVEIGSARMMQEAGIDLSGIDTAQVEAKGQTPVFVSVSGKVAGFFGIHDPLKDTAADTVSALKQRGLTVAMLTGDTENTARAIADQLVITECRAALLPDGKLAALTDLRNRYGPVAFVGDGINDAPALAHADVGIAIGGGTDIAVDAADIVLISGDPGGVVTALDLSQKAMRNIRQNLFWAFAYNAALIPVAAGVLYPTLGLLLSPQLAAGAMALSSVFVLSNALRLRKA